MDTTPRIKSMWADLKDKSIVIWLDTKNPHYKFSAKVIEVVLNDTEQGSFLVVKEELQTIPLRLGEKAEIYLGKTITVPINKILMYELEEQ